MNSLPLYTIGHGRRPIGEFIDLLKKNGVLCLVDVRSVPFSRFNPQYNKKALAAALEKEGICYLFMGDELGGRPKDPDYLTDGKPDYGKMKHAGFFHKGIAQLTEIHHQQLPAAIMCSESKPIECHRCWLIGPALQLAGIELHHIDEAGRIKKQQELLRDTDEAPDLFSGK